MSFYLTNATSTNGLFTVAGSVLKYELNGFGSAPREDPAGPFFYDRTYVRFSDGTNASPYVLVRVLSFDTDIFPTGAEDGIPDSWMIQYFGSADPTGFPNRAATADFDRDGVSNRDEFRAGTSPIDPNSRLSVTQLTLSNLQWLATPYEVYEVHGSTNLASYSRVVNPIRPVTTNGAATGFATLTNGQQFFRVLRVP